MYKYHRSYLVIYKYMYASRKLIDNCLIYNDSNSDNLDLEFFIQRLYNILYIYMY